MVECINFIFVVFRFIVERGTPSEIVRNLYLKKAKQTKTRFKRTIEDLKKKKKKEKESSVVCTTQGPIVFISLLNIRIRVTHAKAHYT